MTCWVPKNIRNTLTHNKDLPLFITDKSIWWLLPVVVWALVIFVIISLPPDNIPRTPLLQLHYIDKAIHFLIFAVFGLLLLLGIHKYRRSGSVAARHIIWALVIGVLYGAGTEAYQYFYLPGRHGNMSDVIANFFGTVFGILIVVMVYRNGKAKKET